MSQTLQEKLNNFFGDLVPLLSGAEVTAQGPGEVTITALLDPHDAAERHIAVLRHLERLRCGQEICVTTGPHAGSLRLETRLVHDTSGSVSDTLEIVLKLNVDAPELRGALELCPMSLESFEKVLCPDAEQSDHVGSARMAAAL